jgi:hypothetical protein
LDVDSRTRSILAPSSTSAIPIRSAPAKVAPVIGPASDEQDAPDQKAVNVSIARRASQPIFTGENMGATSPSILDPTAARSGISSLWAKEANIHNPILRTAAKIGTGALGILETAGTIAAPRITAAIPGTRLNEAIRISSARNAEGQEAKTGLEKAQASDLEAQEEERRKQTENPTPKGTPDEQTFASLLNQSNPATGKPYSALEAFQKVNQTKQDEKPPSAEEDKRQYGTLLDKLHTGTITPSEQTQLNQLQSIYPNLAPMGEAAAGQANARMVDYLSQNPDTRKKVAKGQVPDEYRVLPTDTREEAKDKEARAQGLGSAAQRQITINENHGEKGIEAVVAQTAAGTVYESKAAAEAAGHKILNKASPPEVEKARQAYTQYGRMIDNAQEAMMTMPAWKNENDRKLGMQVSKQFFSHIPVVGVDPGYVDQFLNSDDYRGMSKQGQEHMQNMFQIWSDAINVVKQETGGVPRGQMFLQKEDAILPHPEKTYDMNIKALNSFVKRMKKDSSEYPRPAEMQPLQGGIAPADAKGYINRDGQRIGYVDAQGNRVEF